MDCSEVRAALSARLDGEPTGVDDAVVDAHLSACESCQRWFEQAVLINRALLVSPVVSETTDATDETVSQGKLDDLSEKILVTVEPARRRRERAWSFFSALARGILVILGVLWCVWGLFTLIDATSITSSLQFGIAGDAMSGGIGQGALSGQPGEVNSAAGSIGEGAAALIQLAAIRAGLGVGLFWAAWRPRAAMGMAPVYGAVAMASVGFSVRDLVLGNLGGAEISGLLLMLGSALALAAVWLGGYTPTALAQAWRAAAGLPVTGVPPRR